MRIVQRFPTFSALVAGLVLMFSHRELMVAASEEPATGSQPSKPIEGKAATVGRVPAKKGIDLFHATIDGRVIFDLSIDELTDLLGRPSASEESPYKELSHVISPKVHYHDKGLSFWFSGSDHPKHRCQMVEIYLSKSWDEYTKSYFLPYRGRLTPSIDSNWKAKRVVSEFATLGPVSTTGEEHRQNLESRGVRNVGGQIFPHFVMIELPTHSVSFAHDNTTKYLEKVVLSANKKK